MPKKPNGAGGMQEYIPAGNGDASGEYGNSKGENKHFSTFKKGSSAKSETKGSNTPKPTSTKSKQVTYNGKKYDVDSTAYNDAIINVFGTSITDEKKQGIGGNGYTVFDEGEEIYFKTFDEAYKYAKKKSNAEEAYNTGKKIIDTKEWGTEENKMLNDYLSQNPDIKNKIKKRLEKSYNNYIREYGDNDIMRSSLEKDYEDQLKALDNFNDDFWDLDTLVRDDFLDAVKETISNEENNNEEVESRGKTQKRYDREMQKQLDKEKVLQNLLSKGIIDADKYREKSLELEKESPSSLNYLNDKAMGKPIKEEKNSTYSEKKGEFDDYFTTDIERDFIKLYGHAPDPYENPSQFEKYAKDLKKWREEQEREKARKLFNIDL